MIRYDCDLESLKVKVRSIDSRWLQKAKARTSKINRLGMYQERSNIWSAVKPAFVKLQKNKCVYCERQFETVEDGLIEYDVEHFRPKASVAAWPDGIRHPNVRYPFSTGAPLENGYYWLAYDLLNYAAACGNCNSKFKHTFFPIAGNRGTATDSVGTLAAEKPLLCYPIGCGDADPEDLVEFVATTAVPAANNVLGRRRAEVIIEFFQLNTREQLHRERARMISLFGPALAAISAGTSSPGDERVVKGMDSDALPHANCLRSFKRLWNTNPVTAKRAYELCREFAISEPGTRLPNF